MGLAGRRWLVLALFLLVFSVGLTGCKDSGTPSSSASILLAAQFSENVSESERSVTLDAAIGTIRRRLDAHGVTDSVVEKEGSDRILVEVSGVSNVEIVVELIEKTGYMEFREVEANNGAAVTLADYLSDNRTDFLDTSVRGSRVFAFPTQSGLGRLPPAILMKWDGAGSNWVDVNGDPIDPATLGDQARQSYSWMPAVGQDGVPLTGAYLTKAVPQYYQTQTDTDEIAVGIEWNSEGLTIFNQIAGRLYGRTYPLNALGMFIDGELISSPTVQQSEYGNSAVIHTYFTWDQARLLAIRLDSGALPVPLHVVSVAKS
jgi:preprotein translocase subunit SecD